MEQAELIWAEDTSMPPEWVIHEHSHSYYHLFFVSDGCAEFQIAGSPLTVGAKHYILFAPNVSHGMRNSGEPSHIIELKFSIYDDFINSTLAKRAHLLACDESQTDTIRYIASHWGDRQPEVLKNIEILLLSLLRYLIIVQERSAVHQTGPYELYSTVSQRVMRYVEQHFKLDISLDTMARDLGYNKSYISSAFSRNTGMTVTDYVNFVRLQKAGRSLFYNRMDIASTAQSMGFRNVSYFNRKFREVFGVSPGVFRDILAAEPVQDSPLRQLAEEVFIEQYQSVSEAVSRSRELAGAIRQKYRPENEKEDAL